MTSKRNTGEYGCGAQSSFRFDQPAMPVAMHPPERQARRSSDARNVKESARTDAVAVAAEAPALSAPIGVNVKEARRLLGIGHTLIHELMKLGEIKRYKIGSRTFVEAASITRYIERRLQS